MIRTYVLSAAAKMQRTLWIGWFSIDTLAVKMADGSSEALPPGKSMWSSGRGSTGPLPGMRAKARTVDLHGEEGNETRRIYWKSKGHTTIRTPRSTLRVENQEGGVDSRHASYMRVRVDYRPVMVASIRQRYHCR